MVGRGLREVTSRRFHCGPPKHLLRVGLPWLLPPHRRRLPRCPSTSPQRDPAARPRASSGETSFLKAAHLDLLPREGWSFAREVEGARGADAFAPSRNRPHPFRSGHTHTPSPAASHPSVAPAELGVCSRAVIYLQQKIVLSGLFCANAPFSSSHQTALPGILE